MSLFLLLFFLFLSLFLLFLFFSLLLFLFLLFLSLFPFFLLLFPFFFLSLLLFWAMGNGASASQLIGDDESLDYEKAAALVPLLRQQLTDRDRRIDRLQGDVQRLRHQLHQKETEVGRLNGEMNKFRSVLEARVGGSGGQEGGKQDLLATIHEESIMAGQESRQKKQGVSGESGQTGHGVQELRHFEKDFKYVHSIVIYICLKTLQYIWPSTAHVRNITKMAL